MGVDAGVLLATTAFTAAQGAVSYGVAEATKPDTPDLPDTDAMDQQAQSEATRAEREQRRRAAAAMGRSDTILTGSQGVQGQAPGQRKTLLGQ